MVGVVLYTVLRELFSSNSPNSLYDRAVSDCLKNEKLLDLLGEPVKAFGDFDDDDDDEDDCAGEETRRGRRTHVARQEYQDPEGRRGIRLQFYLKGVLCPSWQCLHP
jgi:import inner membrane translocase subunit TIM21